MEARRTDARVAAMVAAHGEALRRVARRYSANAEDAEDAVQRGLEIYVRRLGCVDPATELAWLKVVVRHEALAVRRGRGEAESGGEVDLDAHPAPDQRSLDELVAGRERAGRVAEALRRLKPDEARALLLKADGLSYGEIGERMGWSYTKVNRALTEGRKRFFELYGEIETGEACERAAPALAALARGRADARTMLELRPHLRHCSACRAMVRRLHARRRARAAALAPLPWLQGLAQRLQGADVVASMQYAAAAGGGGRGAALGAMAALCVGAPAAAGCGPAANERAAAPAVRAAVDSPGPAARPSPAVPVRAASATVSGPAPVVARVAGRAGGTPPEFAFELRAEPAREAAARDDGAGGAFERGASGARPVTGGAFERGARHARAVVADTFERGSDNTSSATARGSDNTPAATTRGSDNAPRATTRGSDRSGSDTSTRAAQRADTLAAVRSAASAGVEGAGASPTFERGGDEPPAARSGFERGGVAAP